MGEASRGAISTKRQRVLSMLSKIYLKNKCHYPLRQSSCPSHPAVFEDSIEDRMVFKSDHEKHNWPLNSLLAAKDDNQ